ncbi:endonuclease domain-containing protein [Streptomyces lydicus]|uniref:endonuclease domain-containing protein n=1 Tax=Streptomyces lydicus TaxID=47763 RepID=UPI0037959E44
MHKARIHRSGGKSCEFDGCRRPHHAKGLCRAHRMQQLKGNTLKPLAKKQMTKAEFAEVLKSGLHDCRLCLEVIPLDGFYVRNGRPMMICKICTQDQVTANSFAFPSVDALNMFRISRGYVCGICGVSEQDVRENRLVIDHDHSCCPEPGKGCQACVRGLLCRGCNIMLGHYESLPEKLRSWEPANSYLRVVP